MAVSNPRPQPTPPSIPPPTRLLRGSVAMSMQPSSSSSQAGQEAPPPSWDAGHWWDAGHSWDAGHWWEGRQWEGQQWEGQQWGSGWEGHVEEQVEDQEEPSVEEVELEVVDHYAPWAVAGYMKGKGKATDARPKGAARPPGGAVIRVDDDGGLTLFMYLTLTPPQYSCQCVYDVSLKAAKASLLCVLD